ncbi:hypothetical protein [Mycobacterium shimoidei]|uniref:hypothetical protein n=1 Tax=Mycobacterium shimoidei TaxID=29313 RepID=UPI000DE80ABA|nr:hypothetical protein [Mycobacterium shimoidei]
MAREAYAHDAVVTIEPGADSRAVGGAITVALCGHWDHQPPCPLAPHHTTVTPVGERFEVRVLFATEPANEHRVRVLIAGALAGGRLSGPDGRITTWCLQSDAPSDVHRDEQEHARRLVGA